MSIYPKITIVTPSFNQAKYLEKTILSVLQQEYPNLEYIIMDGGSNDGSVEIIKKYQHKLAYWESRPDEGQADAIYRGLEQSTGQILGWINSDDYYLPGAFSCVADKIRNNSNAELFIGNSIVVDENGILLNKIMAYPVSFNRLLFWHWGFSQPATFWRREPFFETGGFNRSMQFCFDYDMYLRLLQRRPACLLGSYVAAFRVHDESKTTTIPEVRQKEDLFLHAKYGKHLYNPWLVKAIRMRYKQTDKLILFWRNLISILGIENIPIWKDD